MNDLEQYREDKMAQAEIERFENVKVTDRDQVEGLYEEMRIKRNELMRELSESDNQKEREILHDVLYELKTAKNKIGSQLNAIARAKIMGRRNGA